ncbi:MAG: hypothetical protein Q4C73_04295 [Eubacteriales bacterium]|nr:hypothetical protein [Eubacteriales bacterium]
MEWLSRPTKRLLLEMSVGVILWNLVLAVLAAVFLPGFSYPVKPVILGLITGAAGAMLMLVHMAVITERALDSQSESYANKFTVAASLLRKVVFVAALAFLWRIVKIDLLAAVIGAMGMKAGAYLQPLVRRVSGGGEKNEPFPGQPDTCMKALENERKEDSV